MGSINFFKKPSLNITATVRTNKNVYLTGEQVNATVQVSNQQNGYIFVAVTEDQNFDDNIMSNIAFQTYLQNELNENALYMFNPRQILSMYSGNASANNSEANLELLLAASALNQQVFDLTVIKQLLDDAADFRNLQDLIGLD